jgi:WD40 repeat protein
MKAGILSIVLAVTMALGARAQPTPDMLWEDSLSYGYVVTDVVVSPDGAYTACPHNGSVDIRQISDGSLATNLALGGTWVSDLCFSPDGKYLAAAGSSGQVRVWQVADWSVGYSVPASGPITFSPDSKMLATVVNQEIQLRNSTNGVLLRNWTNFSTTFGGVVALAFAPDGSMLASGAGYRGTDTNLTIWSVPAGGLLRTVSTAQTYHVGAIMFSPDGQWVATAGGEYAYGAAQLWRVSDWQLVQTFSGGAYSASFSPDGGMLAVIGSNIDFYKLPNGALLQHYSDSAHGSHYQKALAFTPDGSSFLRVCYPEIFRARTPFVIYGFTRRNSKWQISWTGGNSLYQLQECTNLLNGAWQDLGGPMTNRTVEVELRSYHAFYRVVAVAD